MLRQNRKVSEKSIENQNNYYKYTALIFIILLMSTTFYPNLFVFIIKENQTLSSHFLLPGEGVSLRYKHSVEKTPVQEIYMLKLKGGFIMDRTVFQSYGAGLPLESKNFSIDENNFIIKDMGIELNELRIRISRTPGQIINIKKKKYDLQEIGRPGELIILRSGSLFSIIKKLIYSGHLKKLIHIKL